LSIDNIASVSHVMPAHRTMFVKPSMSHNHTQFTCGDKGKTVKRTSHKNFKSIPTCHHYGIRGHIHPNCFQIRSKKPWDKLHVPREGELGFENQVKNLSDQVKLISEKLGSLTPNEKKSVLTNKKNTSKQVWVKKEDNLCLVAHTVLNILDTCL
jgi:hypothetical protein